MRLILLTLALALLPPSAHGSPHQDHERGSDFGWVFVDGERQSASELRDFDRLDELQARYGDHVLCVRKGDERYVITKAEYLERARKAVRRVGENKVVVKRWKRKGGSPEGGEAMDRRGEARDRLQEAVQALRGEIREILREARSGGDAELLR